MEYLKVTPVLQIMGLLDEHHKYIKSAGINFIDYGNTKVAQKITEWAMNYHYEFLPLFVDYLEILIENGNNIRLYKDSDYTIYISDNYIIINNYTQF